MLLTYSGLPHDALALLEPVGEPTGPRARALAAFAEVPALIAVGRCETAVEEASRAFVELTELPDQIAISGRGIHIILQIYALTECGRFDEAAGPGPAGVRRHAGDGATRRTDVVGPPARPALLLRAGRSQRRGGGCERPWPAARSADIVGPSRLVLSALATAEAYLGDVAAAQAAVAELERLPRFGFVEPEQEMGRAWAQAVAGDLAGARQSSSSAAADHAARDRLPRLRGVAPARRRPSR